MKQYYQINKTKAGCKFKGMFLTHPCDECGEVHDIAEAEFDTVDISEAIRIIDFYRSEALAVIDTFSELLLKPSVAMLLDGEAEAKKKKDTKIVTCKEKSQALIKKAERIQRESNDAIKELCIQHNLFRTRKEQQEGN